MEIKKNKLLFLLLLIFLVIEIKNVRSDSEYTKNYDVTYGVSYEHRKCEFDKGHWYTNIGECQIRCVMQCNTLEEGLVKYQVQADAWTDDSTGDNEHGEGQHAYKIKADGTTEEIPFEGTDFDYRPFITFDKYHSFKSGIVISEDIQILSSPDDKQKGKTPITIDNHQLIITADNILDDCRGSKLKAGSYGSPDTLISSCECNTYYHNDWVGGTGDGAITKQCDAAGV